MNLTEEQRRLARELRETPEFSRAAFFAGLAVILFVLWLCEKFPWGVASI